MEAKNITEAEMWADIDAAFPKLPEREPGDIDSVQWALHKGVSRNTALRQMQKLAENGKWEVVTVYSATSGKRNVIRRVK